MASATCSLHFLPNASRSNSAVCKVRTAGLVQVRKDAQRRLYRLDPRPIAQVDAWLAPYRQRWNESLDRLDEHLKEHP